MKRKSGFERTLKPTGEAPVPPATAGKRGMGVPPKSDADDGKLAGLPAIACSNSLFRRAAFLWASKFSSTQRRAAPRRRSHKTSSTISRRSAATHSSGVSTDATSPVVAA